MARFTRQNLWQTQVDYLDKLSPEEREWLKMFDRSMYLSGSGENNPLAQPLKDKKDSKRAKTEGGKREYAQRVDAMNTHNLQHNLREDPDTGKMTTKDDKEKV
jgi:hypothetical protein